MNFSHHAHANNQQHMRSIPPDVASIGRCTRYACDARGDCAGGSGLASNLHHETNCPMSWRRVPVDGRLLPALQPHQFINPTQKQIPL